MSRIIVVFDTYYSSSNLGDRIIMESVYDVLNRLIQRSDIFVFKIATHSRISPEHRSIISRAYLKILCGTNLFHFEYTPFARNNPWKISFKDISILKNTILFGVGSLGVNLKQIYKKSIRQTVKHSIARVYSPWMWKKILHPDAHHSVRDSDAVRLFRYIGLSNVLNTGCPTLWKLVKEHCEKIPNYKAKDVVLTFTSYNKNYEKDAKILEIALRNYRRVYIWPQGMKDYDYIIELLKMQTDSKMKNVTILPSKLSSYDELLKHADSLDYVGTRLHGGIRALQHGRRAIIIAVDNRALVFKRDFNIPSISRDEISNLEYHISRSFKTRIYLNHEAIYQFKNKLASLIND